MEFWEITKDRSQKTLVVWQQHVPTLHIGNLASSALDTLIDGFDPLVAARIDAQDTFDAAFRAVQNSLAIMRVLGTKVPQIIEGQLDGNQSIEKDVKDLYANSPRTESTILKRLRELLPVLCLPDRSSDANGRPCLVAARRTASARRSLGSNFS